MSKKEGIRRVARGVQAIGEALSVLLTVIAVSVVFTDGASANFQPSLGLIAAGFFFLALFHGFAWIIRGFAED